MLGISLRVGEWDTRRTGKCVKWDRVQDRGSKGKCTGEDDSEEMGEG